MEAKSSKEVAFRSIMNFIVKYTAGASKRKDDLRK